jgi:ATP-dependent helicase YprA (DUF1998 family)
MRRETRTTAQVEANRIDMEMFRVARMLEQFAEDHRSPEADAAALKILQSRHAIRSHMHKNDREATNG